MNTKIFKQLTDVQKIKAIDSGEFNPTVDNGLLFEHTFSPIVFQKLVDCKASLYHNEIHLIIKMIADLSTSNRYWKPTDCPQILYLINVPVVAQYRGHEDMNILHTLVIMLDLGMPAINLIEYILEHISSQSQINWCLSEFDCNKRTPCTMARTCNGQIRILDTYAKMIQQFRRQLFILICPVLQVKDITGIVLDFLVCEESM